ncbi:MAG: c-type cytochrome [Halioglobus sp.]
MSRCDAQPRRGAVAMAALLLGSVVCAQAADYPEFEGDTMALGRSTWLANCETCHAYGVAGAPLYSDSEEWATRSQKGVDTLYKHAIEGFFGPRGTMMPARGANDSLSDEEVSAAVDYMLRLAADSTTP